MKTLNIGILAHVDAGKTSLTERLLFETGAIETVGSVDSGTTQTDSMDLERKRGITIRSAVVSFSIDDLDVNLIDTPGHADFISEVERALRVLDGAILVVSAVEGVQAQTRVLMRTLQRLGVPTLIFANKIDRMGAGTHVVTAIRERLTPHVVVMSEVQGIGTAAAQVTPRSFGSRDFPTELAETLADADDALLAAYLDDPHHITAEQYRAGLAAQVCSGRVCPVFYGSAVTGEGVADLVQAIGQLMPTDDGNADGPLSGTVFKIERGAAGEKVAYVRLWSGSMAVRDRITFYRPGPGGQATEYSGKITAMRVFGRRGRESETRLSAGGIAEVRGLKDVLIGDRIGESTTGYEQPHFARPGLESEIRAEHRADQTKLYAALRQLAEQDPFINVRRADGRQAITVSLYGEVQKEVIQATLAERFGISVGFGDTQTVYIEKVTGVGTSAEVIDKRGHDGFYATVGFRVEPGQPGSGVVYRLGVEPGSLPGAFHTAIRETVHETLRQGLCGWEVSDCVVTLTHSGYASPVSTGWDFRALTPLVLMDAVRKAGTRVYEPVNRFEVETPVRTLNAVLKRLAEAGAVPEEPVVDGDICRVEGTLPASRVHEVERRLPALFQGEGVFLSEFAEYRPVAGKAPVRPRTGANPLDRQEYLVALSIKRSAGRP
ncbi:ribosomal protection tetracycline resistance protein [Nocardiopsis mwathae]|uniref:Ribosomal protection tetracycline resistance protein n=1 Tax=Nocardiopsis mwathae TaxID=1472723 RepID=A0A7X0D7I0_9ACTN|nr:TetM/TetW/TetO/TetS family tetracycline resistance ribosomal protection protein [Nocardiopsis mwathae]MBB6174483.1 ribosomal protection tetracycline resistance protein [Nocardiopsis mwathae]